MDGRVLPISPSVGLAGVGVATDAFPQYFPNALAYGTFAVALVADGWGGRTASFGPVGLPTAFAPNGLITQVFLSANGKLQASTPLTFTN